MKKNSKTCDSCWLYIKRTLWYNLNCIWHKILEQANKKIYVLFTLKKRVSLLFFKYSNLRCYIFPLKIHLLKATNLVRLLNRLRDEIPSFFNHNEKLVESDWPRAMQFRCNTSELLDNDCLNENKVWSEPIKTFAFRSSARRGKIFPWLHVFCLTIQNFYIYIRNKIRFFSFNLE